MEKKKEYNYYDGFVELSNYSLKSANMLHDIVQNYSNTDIPAMVVEMHNIEHAADIAKHDMMNRLMKEFLPPIEREDIISLAQKIDNVTDAIEDVLIRLDIYNVQSIRSETAKFTELIVKCCESMDQALKEFKHFKKSSTLQTKIIEMNRLEEDGDELYTNAVRFLYQTSKDPIELMVWTEISQRLEKCCDACEDVADDIETVVMKNS
jgi:predicted phosphate transport protein (TIGR00153 family)